MKIGIIGAGQLARMLALSATPLGVHVSCIGKKSDCASDCAEVIEIALTDTEALQKWAQSCDVVTFENENIDIAILEKLAQKTTLHPSIKAIETAQDRLVEKDALTQAGIETAPYWAIDSLQDLEEACATLGEKAILKTRRFGYDGKGQYMLTSSHDIPKAWEALKDADGGLIYEGFVDFDYEISQLCTVNASGECALYPLTKNIHSKGILLESQAPFHAPTLQKKAGQSAEKLAQTLGYVGTLAIEFFVCGDHLIANEIAPRVHNSGHWTIEGATTSQFENHMRAVAGLALGATTAVETVMLNCIGAMPTIDETSALSHCKRHDYNKADRVGRKVGHVTVRPHCEESKKELESLRGLVEKYLQY